MDNPRALALLSLIKSDVSECYTNIEISTTLKRARLEPSDSALYTRLYLGVIEKRMYLDHVIKKYSRTNIDLLDPETKNALRLGIYQLILTDKIPEYSAVDESVRIAPKRSKGLVNAILRSFIRDGKKIALPKDKWEALSIEYSVPMELINLFRSSYKDTEVEKLLTHTPKNHTSLRVNSLRTSTDGIIAILKERGIEARTSSIARDVVLCTASISQISDLLENGLLFVQDEASRVASQLLDAQSGEIIADVCACPGGKSFSIAIDMQNKGELYSSDLHASKLTLIEKGANTLGIDIIRVKEQNAKTYALEYERKFDRVICDVPCSGLGVIFKKPEIKYKSIDGINALPKVQYDILSNVKNYVKCGGVLLYSTCTLCKAENEDNVKRFLSENSDFVPVPITVNGKEIKEGMYTFMPHSDNTDGFFVAKMRRVR